MLKNFIQFFKTLVRIILRTIKLISLCVMSNQKESALILTFVKYFILRYLFFLAQNKQKDNHLLNSIEVSHLNYSIYGLRENIVIKRS